MHSKPETKLDYQLNPLSFGMGAWVLLLVFLWAGNTVVAKLVLKDIPLFWAVFFRFMLAMPFIVVFILWRKTDLRISLKNFAIIALLGVLTLTQLILFMAGTKFTTGGRATLFLFSYPLLVPLLAPLFIKGEKINFWVMAGSFIAFIGLLLPMHKAISEPGGTLKGDLLELLSSLCLAFMIIYSKQLITRMNKWNVFFWRNMVLIVLCLGVAILTEKLDLSKVNGVAWGALSYQVLAASVFCFLSYQYILSKHSPTAVSVFFFATPLFGMLIGIALLGEKFEWPLLTGCVLVGIGIFLVNWKYKGS